MDKFSILKEKLEKSNVASISFDWVLDNYFKDIFPVFEKVQKIDSMLTEDEIDVLFEGFTSLYLNIKIEPLPPSPKI